MSRTLTPPHPAAETKSNVGDGGRGTTPLCLLISSSRGVVVTSLSGCREVVIGRGDNCDVRIQDDSVSRRHARLRLGERISIEDLGSSNGTVVEGQRLRPYEEVLVRVGTVFELGATTVVFHRNVGFPAPERAVTNPPPAAGGDRFGAIVEDASMKRIYGLLDAVGPSPLSVLVLGETGVGKEVFAEALHRQSDRATMPFLQINCAALPESILESELFGHEKGAFTGADATKIGLFEAASGGTLFLDEIGEAPLSTQVKLLRMLENGEVLRIGSRRPLRVDVRFVSATNRDPRALIAEGRFRADLYHRLNGLTITLPPLRRRLDDVLPLARHFIKQACEKARRATPLMSVETERALLAYDWPGNVRELRKVVERALVISRGALLEPEHFQLETVSRPPSGSPEEVTPVAELREAPSGRRLVERPLGPDDTARRSTESLSAQIALIEEARILEALAQTAGNQSKAAKLLGITRRVLIHRLGLYGIPRPRKGSEGED
jgi:DNA-binding NtrC family response regulator